MSLESKYLKYKQKYLNIKNQIDQIGSGSKFIQAVRSNNLAEVAKKLTEQHGLRKPHLSDANQVDALTGQLPVDIAASLGLTEMVALLKRHGGHPKIVSALMIVDPQNDFCDAIYYDRKDPSVESPRVRVPKGSLAVNDSNSIFPHINRLHDSFTAKNQTIFISQDWHPENHVSFAKNHINPTTSQPYNPFTFEVPLSAKLDSTTTISFIESLWPVHCVAGTPGAEISPLLKRNGRELSIKKGTGIGIEPQLGNLVDSYSAFGDRFHGLFEKSDLQKLIAERGINRLIVCGLATDFCVGSTAIDAKIFFPDMDVVLIEDCMRGVVPKGVAEKKAIMKQKGLVIYNTVDEFMASPHAN
jgi:nicotinamidase/pyrazinamidase